METPDTKSHKQGANATLWPRMTVGYATGCFQMNLEVELLDIKQSEVFFSFFLSSSNFPEEFPPVLIQLRALLSQLFLTVSHLKNSF